MKKNEKSLINKKEGFINKFISFVKNLFRKKEKEVIDNNMPDEPIEEFEEDNFEDDNLEYLEDYYTKEELEYKIKYDDAKEYTLEERNRFFKMYNWVKERKIKLEDLSNNDLFMVNQMLKEELEIKRKVEE